MSKTTEQVSVHVVEDGFLVDGTFVSLQDMIELVDMVDDSRLVAASFFLDKMLGYREPAVQRRRCQQICRWLIDNGWATPHTLGHHATPTTEA